MGRAALAAARRQEERALFGRQDGGRHGALARMLFAAARKVSGRRRRRRRRRGTGQASPSLEPPIDGAIVDWIRERSDATLCSLFNWQTGGRSQRHSFRFSRRAHLERVGGGVSKECTKVAAQQKVSLFPKSVSVLSTFVREQSQELVENCNRNWSLLSR